ncbi:diguanylate cyclase (GGDEF)-like protein [Paucibacter oligotrophus]|uniref:diguanylate cyclase n=1 Tax=Roseateles oligotrophus TaxID=1769250 RepID=A0A840LDJ5_9BURK|nr:tetratricopeptide repeat-containing diguanylate cyclase [Roseateles oligotrophus]MBB4843397.1 diguanylate cyclase (GGDEF)-like protein [Roseateles oligotrophus]
MQEVEGSEVSCEQIHQWLAAANAQRQANVELGLKLASLACDAARLQGYLAEHLEAACLRAFFLYRRGEMEEMLAASHKLLPMLREQGSTPRLCELLRWMAFAAADLGLFEEALAAVNESLARARELGDKRLIAVALNAVGACLERMGDPWQAERLMTEAAALLGEAAGDYERMVSHNNLATVALGMFNLLRHSEQAEHQGERNEALQRGYHHAQAVRPHAQALGESYLLALSDANGAEILLHQGELVEAQALLKGVLAHAHEFGYMALIWRMRCIAAEIALAQGEAEQAMRTLDEVLAESAGRARANLAMRLHHAAYRACKRLGRIEAALGHLERYQGLERERSVTQLMAQARFFFSRMEAERALELAPAGSGPLARPASEEDESLLRDPLTGLGNLRCMAARMPGLIRQAEQGGGALTLALIDVDRFKSIHEKHGAAVADRVLQELAQMLRDNTRGSDLLLRWAGEEFLVVLPDTVADRAFEVCERLRQAVECFPWAQLAPELDVTLSIGLANAPPYATDLLVARAESAMYRAKYLGRNRVALA